ncbi:MAG: hypothetical protein JF603_04365 [Acidobacteria bacterium]|nr:hypothetical protein [Acidobacteriota bacterium]
MTDILDFNSIDIRTIDLSRLEESVLIGQVVPEGVTEPFGLYGFRSDEPGAELGRQLERSVFRESFGDSPELLAAEYDPYEASSFFFVVIDHRRRVTAGVMRVILPSGAGLKSLNDLAREWGKDPAEVIAGTDGAPRTHAVWDVATLAVSPDYRGQAAAGLVSLSLYQALFMTGTRWGNEFLVAILDTAVLRMLQWQLASLFRSFEGVAAGPYLGSASSRPVWCDIAEWRDRLLDAKPVLHDLFFHGTGHEEAVAAPDWDRLATVVREACLAANYKDGSDDSVAAIRRNTAGISSAGIGRQ